MPKIYITNKSGHDYSDALRFGSEIIYLSEGRVRQLAVNSLYRDIVEKLRDSSSDDYVVVTSLPILSAIVCSILARKHGKINLLIYKDGRYLERNILIDELIGE